MNLWQRWICFLLHKGQIVWFKGDPFCKRHWAFLFPKSNP